MGNGFLLTKQRNIFETNSDLSTGYFEICMFVYFGVVLLPLLTSSQIITK